MNATSNFQARLGVATNPGFLPRTERLAQVNIDQNPFVTGHALPENSPAFFGRDYVLHEILAALRHPDKPRCISLLGEPRIGKSSLLNQMFAALGGEEGLVAIRADAQSWRESTPARFFTDLHMAIKDVIGEAIADAPPADAPSVDDPSADAPSADEPTPSLIMDYRAFRNALFPRANRYRFVLILDEFETMLDNPDFDAEFFANLRHLGDTPEFRFGYLLASRKSLAALQERHQAFDSVSFRDIFGLAHVLGLLQQEEGLALMRELWQRSFEATSSSKEIEEIQRQAGMHPALLQIVLDRMWQAREGGHKLDTDGIKQELWVYFRDLWKHRTREEKEVLVRILGGKPVTQHVLLRDLRSRGLIIRKDEKDTLFADPFQEFIRELLPGDPGLAEIMKEKTPNSHPHKKSDHGKGWLGGIFKIADKIGGLRGAAQPKRKE